MFGENKRQKAEGRKRKAESGRQKAEGGRQKAEGSTAHCLLPSAHCPLLTATYAVFFFRKIAAEMSVMIRPTGNGSRNVNAKFTKGFLYICWNCCSSCCFA